MSDRARILIVDDEEAILETMEFTFEGEYDVLKAPSAPEALRLLDANAPIAAVITGAMTAAILAATWKISPRRE